MYSNQEVVNLLQINTGLNLAIIHNEDLTHSQIVHHAGIHLSVKA